MSQWGCLRGRARMAAPPRTSRTAPVSDAVETATALGSGRLTGGALAIYASFNQMVETVVRQDVDSLPQALTAADTTGARW